MPFPEESLPNNPQEQEFEFIGRDFDLLRLERILPDYHKVYLHEASGVGKTAFFGVLVNYGNIQLLQNILFI